MRTRHDRVWPTHRPSRRNRSGISLIQMLVAITSLAIISTIGVRMIGNLLLVERQGVNHVTKLSSLARLSRQFREDTHVAQDCLTLQAPDTGNVRLTFSKAHTVVYQRNDRGIIRTERNADQIVHRDVFRMTAASLTCEPATDSAAIATLVIRLQRPDARVSEEFRIDAQLGRDLIESKNASALDLKENKPTGNGSS
ncbi:MAG: hypothetical protein JWM11_2154 [Planctomycetaceae bacterium]|nr:hypothetical protein [Planctomycetaceae bacterium]